MQKRVQKITVGIIVLIICISLIGTSFAAIYLPQDDQSTQSEVLQKEHEQRKLVVEALSKKLEGNPEDLNTKLALADAYYDKSRVSGQLNLEEYKNDLKKAVEIYQGVLVNKSNDTGIMLKLATSAFLLGELDLAEKTYKELLTKEPQNVDALYGYGMFLFYERNDHKQAKANWQKALTLTSDAQLKSRIQEMVRLTEDIESGVNQQKESK